MIFLGFKSSTKYFKVFMPLEETQVLSNDLKDITGNTAETQALKGKLILANTVLGNEHNVPITISTSGSIQKLKNILVHFFTLLLNTLWLHLTKTF